MFECMTIVRRGGCVVATGLALVLLLLLLLLVLLPVVVVVVVIVVMLLLCQLVHPGCLPTLSYFSSSVVRPSVRPSVR